MKVIFLLEPMVYGPRYILDSKSAFPYIHILVLPLLDLLSSFSFSSLIEVNV